MKLLLVLRKLVYIMWLHNNHLLQKPNSKPGSRKSSTVAQPERKLSEIQLKPVERRKSSNTEKDSLKPGQTPGRKMSSTEEMFGVFLKTRTVKKQACQEGRLPLAWEREITHTALVTLHSDFEMHITMCDKIFYLLSV